MVTHTTPKLPTSLSLGQCTIRFEQDQLATLAFLNGVQAGILAYEVHGKKARLYDTDIILLVVKQQKSTCHPRLFNIGYMVGCLTTLAHKGSYTLTTQAFDEGYQEGMQACCQFHHHQFTLSELACLISWQHRGNESAFNAGYVAGFVESLTQGIRAILTLVRGTK